MILRISVICLTMLILGACHNDPPLKTHSGNRAKEFHSFAENFGDQVQHLVQTHGTPGTTIAIVTKNEMIWKANLGVLSRDNLDPITSNTPFSLQSQSKMLTALAILIAVQDGLLNLDQPITTYLPDFTVFSRFEDHPEKKITLKHLLSHTAGFTHEAPVGNNFDPYSPNFEEHVKSISQTWLKFPVGHHASYSNLGIDLAAYILQVVSKTPFPVYMQEKVLTPLQMTNSSFDIKTIEAYPQRAIGHSYLDRPIPVAVPMLAAGGFYSTGNDMAKFLQFHMNQGKVGNQSILHTKWLQEMYKIPFPLEGQTEGYGLGIVKGKQNGDEVLGHDGGGFGFASTSLWFPDCEIGLIILTNDHNFAYKSPLLKTFAKFVIGQQPRDKSYLKLKGRLESLNEVKLSTHVGRYVGDSGFALLKKDEQGYFFVIDEETFPLVGMFNDTFISSQNNERFRFIKTNKTATYLFRVRDGKAWAYNDGGPHDHPGPNKSEWSRYEGNYTLKNLGVVTDHLTVHRNNGYLYLDEFKLHEFRPGLFFTSHGEALDFNQSTWKNIKMEKVKLD